MTSRILVMMPIAALLLSGCGAGASSGSASSSDGTSGQATSAVANVEEGVQLGSLVPRGEVDGSASALVSIAKGGDIRLPMAEDLEAVLAVPPGAISEDTVITLRAFRSGNHRGLLMEPDGLWLTKPAALTVTGNPALLLRIGAQTAGDLYAPASGNGAGTVWVVRLRPVLVADSEVTPTVITADWSGPQPPTNSSELPPVDPSDGKAAQEEASEAQSPDGEVTDTEGAQDLAATWIPPLQARCSDADDPARARVVATRTTAGNKAPSELPECITRAITVLGLYEFEVKGEEGKIFNSAETVAGETELSNEFEEYRFPLEGEVEGVDRGTSYFLTAMIYGMDQMAGGMANAKEPTGDRCSVTSLENGQMSAKLELLDSDQVQVTLQPLSGTYTISCGGKPIVHSMGVWALVRVFKGMGEDEPFVFTFDKGQRVSNVYSNVQNMQEMRAKKLKDGSIEMGDKEMRIRSLMVVSLYESLKELQEERRKATQTPTPRAS
jgi:hypothetical protein